MSTIKDGMIEKAAQLMFRRSLRYFQMVDRPVYFPDENPVHARHGLEVYRCLAHQMYRLAEETRRDRKAQLLGTHGDMSWFAIMVGPEVEP